MWHPITILILARGNRDGRARMRLQIIRVRVCSYICIYVCVRLCKCMYGRLERGRDAATSLDTRFCTHPQAIVRASLVICSIWADTNSSDVIRVAKITAIALYIGWVDHHFPPDAGSLSLAGRKLFTPECVHGIDERLEPLGLCSFSRKMSSSIFK